MTLGLIEVMAIGSPAEHRKVSQSTLYKLAQEGGLPGQKVGRCWRFHKATLKAWLLWHPARMLPEQEADY